MEHSDKTSNSETVTPVSDADWQKKLDVVEQRRRDTQSMLTPLQQENIRLQAENEVLQTLSGGHTNITLEPAEQARLDDLKFSDPDAWRQEINTLERNAGTKAQESLKAQVQTKISESELKHREQQVHTFFNENTDITMDEFNAVIPLELHNKMAANQMTVDEYLAAGAKILRGAPVASAAAPTSPDLGAVAGSAEPTESAKVKQQAQDWATAVI